MTRRRVRGDADDEDNTKETSGDDETRGKLLGRFSLI
jgi:hypothetical protein